MKLRASLQLKYVISDFVASNLAFLCFNLVRYHYLCIADAMLEPLPQFLTQTKLIFEQCAFPLMMLFIYWLSGYYNNPFQRSRLQELSTTFFSALINTLLIYLLLLTNDGVTIISVNYKILVLLLASLFIFTYASRFVITNHRLRLIRQKKWTFRTIVIGPRCEVEKTHRQLRDTLANLGYVVEGYVVTDDGEASPEFVGVDVFTYDDLPRLCAERKITQLIISPGNISDEEVMQMLSQLFPLNVAIKITPDIFSYVTASIRMKDIYGEPFIDLTSPDISESTKNVKRLCDVAISSLVLLILALPLAVIALLVKRDSEGPAFYTQTRIGRHKKPFEIIKFRTMRNDAEKEGPQLTVNDDERITRIGKWMRKYRIDELPQFYNVLRGDMSIVGPRPEREFFIRQIIKKAPYYTLVHQVRPGITSWGMVKFGYASTVAEMIERTRFDLIYLSNMSIAIDIKILIYTIRTVLVGEGK